MVARMRKRILRLKELSSLNSEKEVVMQAHLMAQQTVGSEEHNTLLHAA
jgi:hypothetical protein